MRNRITEQYINDIYTADLPDALFHIVHRMMHYKPSDELMAYIRELIAIEGSEILIKEVFGDQFLK